MKANSKDVLAAIERVDGAMPNRSTAMHDVCISLSFADDTLYLMCTNGTLFLETTVQTEKVTDEESWIFLAEYKRLKEFVSYVDGTVTFTMKDGHLRLQCGKSWAKVNIIDGAWQMPAMAEETGWFELSSDQFKMLDKSHMRADLSGRSLTGCINLITWNEQLYAVTADGFVSAIVPVQGEIRERRLFDVDYASRIVSACTTAESSEDEEQEPVRFSIGGGTDTLIRASGNNVEAIAALTDGAVIGSEYVQSAYRPDNVHTITVGASLRRALRTIDRMDTGDNRTVEIYTAEGAAVVAWDREFLSDAIAYSDDTWGGEKEYMFSSTAMLGMVQAIGDRCKLMISNHPTVKGGIWFILEKNGVRCTIAARRIKKGNTGE